MTNRLDTIVLRQRSTRVRDLCFAAAVALAAAVSLATVSTAVGNAAPHIAQR